MFPLVSFALTIGWVESALSVFPLDEGAVVKAS